MIELNDLMMQRFLLGVILNTLFVHILIQKLIILDSLKIQIITKGIVFINLPSMVKDKSVIYSITTCFENKESPFICYKCNKHIRSTIFRFNKLDTELECIDSSLTFFLL